MSDLVSIIMPSYNTAQYITETIQSVIDQTYHNWELIIVDDCSTDNTDIVIGKIKDPKVTELVFHKVWHISQFIYIFGRYWNLQFLPAFHRHIINMNFTYSGPGKHFLYIMTMRC